VLKVEFEGKRATGVQFVPNPDFQSEIALSKPVPQTVKARKLVIVSAGALGTPQILERSGVGNKEILEKLDISCVADLPGVGENYMDHHLSLSPYKTSLKPDETIDCLLSGRLDFMKAVKENNKMLGWNAIDVCSKIRPTGTLPLSSCPSYLEADNYDRCRGWTTWPQVRGGLGAPVQERPLQASYADWSGICVSLNFSIILLPMLIGLASLEIQLLSSLGNTARWAHTQLIHKVEAPSTLLGKK
jgi:hypothetical protein